MQISQVKKDLLKKMSGGIHVLMATTYTAEEIAIDPQNKVEKYIAEHLLDYEKSSIGLYRQWFSEKKFDNFIDTKDDNSIKDLLYHLDNIDMCAWNVLAEACIHPKDLTEEEKKIVDLIESEEQEISTFQDLIELY